MNTGSFGDKLRRAFRDAGAAIPARDGDDLTTSQIQDCLQLALVEVAAVPESSTGRLIAWAVEAGRRGAGARVRPKELDACLRGIRAIRQRLCVGSQSKIGKTDLVLAMASLADPPRARQVVADCLVEALDSGSLSMDIEAYVQPDAQQRRLLRRIDLESVRQRHLAHKAVIDAENHRRAAAEADRLRHLEQARREKIQKLRGDILNVQARLLERKVNAELATPALPVKDHPLLMRWAGRRMPLDEKIDIAGLRASMGDWELTRLYSARSAERAAMAYLEGLGMNVADVSITQLDPDDNIEWSTHDIMANKVPIDVKNARQSFSDPSRYSDYLVPAFKKSRSGCDVTIMGVFSQYHTANQIEAGVIGQCTILGFVRQADLNALQGWLKSRFGSLMAIGSFNAQTTLPGWCFEFGTEHLPARAVGRADLRALVHELTEDADMIPEALIPRMMLSLVQEETVVRKLLEAQGAPDFGSYAQEFAMWRAISSVEETLGWSRRSLFTFVLAYTLEQARRDAQGWSPQSFEKWLFLSGHGGNRQRPLGLDDPLEYIAGIVGAMKTLWQKARSSLKEFRSFRLRSPWILTGEDSNGVERTIMAYCGGSILGEDGHFLAKCGLSPLILGQDESCSHCGRLICHECGFCSEKCGRRG